MAVQFGGRWRRAQIPLWNKEITYANKCPICLDELGQGGSWVVGDYGATLPCGHSACASCIVLYIESRVNSGEVSSSDLVCPLPECRKSMTADFISDLLSWSPDGAILHERLLDFQAQRFVPEQELDERLLTCPSAGCCNRVLVPSQYVVERLDVDCPSCKRQFCAACCHPSHPGASCDAAEKERLDPDLQALISAQNWKRCPACRQLCERESGCNFMTCPSDQCKGNTHFCYLCEELLAASDHAAHYEGFEGAIGRAGPFGSVCANRRDVDFSLPTQPPPPSLSVVTGDHEGSIALRITWGPHKSEPATIYYRIRLSVPGANDVKHTSAQAGYPYRDLKNVQRYRRYQASVTPVNVNGSGPASELSEIVHFHPRELVQPDIRTEAEPKSRRWAARS